jgi:hypothetical protein
VMPFKKIAPVRRSFTWKEEENNSTEASLVAQNWKIEIKFFFSWLGRREHYPR